MNYKEAIEQLTTLFSGYSFHLKFLEELAALLKKDLKGKESAFFKCLINQLNYLKDHGRNVHLTDGHEQIKGFDGHFYSIHVQQKGFNVRFLIYIGDDNIPIFLCAFNERAGHKATGYETYTNVLMSRLNEMKEG